MSELFNLSHVFSESTTIAKIIDTYIQKTFLSEAVDILREHDQDTFNSLNGLYAALQEAESKADENSKFAEYFREYKRVIEQYILKAKELASEFSINIETFADANKDILEVPDNANVLATPTYVGVEYINLSSRSIPKIEPYKAFKKEFAFIGQLLQDLGPDVKEETKAQVIASVCNNLSKEINDDWLEKVIEKITGCDDADKSSFARTVYNCFVKSPKSEMQVDIGLVKQSKLAIMNYTEYISCINDLVDDLCDGLYKIADEVGSMFFRNKDNKFPIKTDVDGIEDRTYRLGDYSMNQVNIFISTKISQINELCNLYLIALSIKMDCIIKYLQQCKDIVNTACAGVDNTPNTETDPGDPDDDNDGTPESDDDIPEPDDDEVSEPDDDSTVDDKVDGIEPDDKGTSDSDDTVVQDNSESEIKQECYLFEAELFNKERYINYYALQEAYLVEDGEANNAQNTAKKKSLQAIVQNLINQVGQLVQKFVSSFTGKYSAQIAYIEKNKDRIQKAVIPEKWTIQRIDIKPLLNIQIADFSDSDIGLLGDKNKYLQEKYGSILGDVEGDASVKDRILAKVYSKEEDKYTNNDRTEGLAYVTNTYKTAVTNIQNAKKKVDSAGNRAKSMINKLGIGESGFVFDEKATMAMYFSEDGTDITDDDKQKNATKNPETAKEASKQEAIRAYFTINSSVITALMNIYDQAMSKHISFLSKLAQLNGAKPMKQDNENNEEQNNNNE